MKKNLPLILGVILFISNSYSQQFQRCYTDQILESIRYNDPDEYQSIMESKARIHDHVDYVRNGVSKSTDYRIAVVFHVLHSGESVGSGSNLDSIQIVSTLKILNEDYNRANPDTSNTPSIFKQVAGSMNIEFVLAKKDPSGNPSFGITRHNYGQQSNTNNINNNIKPVTTWDSDYYLNIWIADMDNMILGYASFPGGNKSKDGVVLDYRYVGASGFNNSPEAGPYNGGRTATHEVGHYLGLNHTFLGSCSGTSSFNCASSGDQICDTPPTSNENFGCHNGTTLNSCSEIPVDGPDMPMNYMDYGDDACMNLFTKGQVGIMEATLNTVRSSLQNSPALEKLFTFTGQVIDEKTSLGVANASVVFIGNDEEYELTTDANGFFYYSSFIEGNYAIYSGKWGYMTKEHAVNQTIDKNSPSITIPMKPGVYYDDFIMDFGWTLAGDATEGVWERDVPESATFDGNQTQPDADLSLDFGEKCYVTGKNGGLAVFDDVDGGMTRLISPLFDLTSMNKPVLTYGRWFFNDGNLSPNDELVIRITNGSQNIILETVDNTEANTNEWKTSSFNLKDHITSTNIMRLYVEVSDFPIAEHIVDAAFDAFKVEDADPLGIGETQIVKDAISISPNPAAKTVHIDLSATQNPLGIKFFDMSGQLVTEIQKPSKLVNQVDISGLSSGMYIIRVSTEETIYQDHLIVY